MLLTPYENKRKFCQQVWDKGVNKQKTMTLKIEVETNNTTVLSAASC